MVCGFAIGLLVFLLFAIGLRLAVYGMPMVLSMGVLSDFSDCYGVVILRIYGFVDAIAIGLYWDVYGDAMAYNLGLVGTSIGLLIRCLFDCLWDFYRIANRLIMGLSRWLIWDI